MFARPFRPVVAPLLVGTDAARARDAVGAVAAVLAAAPGEPFAVLAAAPPAERAAMQVSLSTGWAGAALLLDALDAVEPGRGHDDVAAALLGRAVDAIPDTPLDLSLHGGVVGVAFAAEVITARTGDDDLNGAVDEVLAELLAAPWVGEADVFDGLAGLGAYLLERARNRRPGAETLLARVVTALAAGAVSERGGVTWPSRLGLRELGLAHGTAGVVALLAKLHRAGIERARVAPLLRGGVAWLRSFEQPGERRFPGALAVSGRLKPARHGWCSGDLAVATALHAAADALEDREGVAAALAVARAASGPAPASAVSVDASICHGEAGAAHLLHRLYRASGDEVLGAAAIRAQLRVLALHRPGGGCGGFLFADGEGAERQWVAHPGLLVGAAGAALVLLGALHPAAATRWDRALLLGDA